ncbi:hypothetical protein [Lentzea sp. NEAU-D7]|uniref:hypothetical protein n=1 Tax=Lentzea sp. NEAU-D7 TaxID=2994667 RepID=UPI00224A6A55|nr:hypothetical protein [Lentzea sp. NEAU-D7]MCX2951589.1 hypothetical protein [Lentzea sp. NEAU-D7]
MFVSRPSFDALTAFITGYDEAARRLGAPGLRGWSEWLVACRGRDCNHAWPGQVLHMAIPEGWENLWALAPDVEARAIEVLFDLLDRFLAERDNSDTPEVLCEPVRQSSTQDHTAPPRARCGDRRPPQPPCAAEPGTTSPLS